MLPKMAPVFTVESLCLTHTCRTWTNMTPITFNTALTVTWMSGTCWQLKRNGEMLISAKEGVCVVNDSMKAICQLCRIRIRPLEIKPVGQVYSTYWVYSNSTFMLKKFTFSLSDNTKLNNYRFWTSFLAFSICWMCSLYVWMKFHWDAG